MLEARDELRHPHNDDHFWRESLYFNFADGNLGIGGWVYLWVLPNQELKSGMLCSFYKGLHPDLDTSKRAQAQPDHIERAGDGRWMYFFTKNVPELLEADFDDVELCGLHLRRLEPLKRHSLQYEDDAGNGFDLNGSFLTLPYDYADHPNPTPDWMAANRYHRAWAVNGTLRIGGETLQVNTTGDSDHSWGRRHGGDFQKFNFKMWSAQVKPDFAFSVVTMGEMGAEIPYGFLARAGKMHPVVRVSESGKYDSDGVQRTIQAEFEDDTGYVVRASAEQFSSIAAGTPGAYWGHEGGARYSIEGVGETTGIVSYFWPGSVRPDSMPG
jgi:hypothetical protein